MLLNKVTAIVETRRKEGRSGTKDKSIIKFVVEEWTVHALLLRPRAGEAGDGE